MYLIPSIVVYDNLAYHTINHSINKYIGDPVNILKILSDYGVKEIALVIKDLESMTSIRAAVPFVQRPISVTGPIAEPKIIHNLINCGVDRVGIKYSSKKRQLTENLSVEFGQSTLIANIDIFSVDELTDKLANEIILLSHLVGEVIIHDICSSGQRVGLNPKLVRFVNELSKLVNIRISVEGGFNTEPGKLNGYSSIYYSTSYIFTQKKHLDFNNIMIRPL